MPTYKIKIQIFNAKGEELLDREYFYPTLEAFGLVENLPYNLMNEVQDREKINLAMDNGLQGEDLIPH